MVGRAVAYSLLLVLTPAVAQARKTVLLVFDEEKDLPGLALINRSVQDVLKTGLDGDVEIHTESLSVSRFKDPRYDSALGDYFRVKYAEKHLDLLVAIMEPSLDFLLRHRSTSFPGVPIVFCGIDSSDLEAKTSREFTGVLVKRTFAPTLEIALRLQPDTRNVFVVGGASRFDQRLLAIARRDFEPFQQRVTITYLSAQPMDDLLETVSHLPAHSLISYLTYFADNAGHSFSPHEALSRIAAIANAPIYVSLDQYVGLGAVGGHVYSIDNHGRRAAQIGLRILRGESASSIPVVEADDYENLFDWRQLKRWGLEEGRLPPHSVVEFRRPSLWDDYKWYFTGAVTLFLLQSLLVAGLLVSRAQRRRADLAARASEEEVRKQRDELAHALRLTTLGEMSASLAHEIGQPLAGILANAQAAQRMIVAGTASTDDVASALGDIWEIPSSCGKCF